MMTDFDAFLPQVLITAPGCPEPAAINALRHAAQRFCERTRVWRCEDEFDVTPDHCAFVCAPDGAELFEIEQVTFNGFPLEAISISELTRRWPRWREDDGSSDQARFFTQVAPDTIQVVPRSTGRAKVFGFFKPSEDAEQLPAFLARKYLRTIAAGALADLLILPGQPFFSPDLATVNQGIFNAALDRNFSLNVRGQQRAPIRTRGHFF
jgi:hypothetical protein